VDVDKVEREGRKKRGRDPALTERGKKESCFLIVMAVCLPPVKSGSIGNDIKFFFFGFVSISRHEQQTVRVCEDIDGIGFIIVSLLTLVENVK
jgi:hypothetical protein